MEFRSLSFVTATQDAVGKSMTATRRHFSGRMRVLVTSWNALGKAEDQGDQPAEKQAESAEFTYEQEARRVLGRILHSHTSHI